jgi:hypothetical protein
MGSSARRTKKDCFEAAGTRLCKSGTLGCIVVLAFVTVPVTSSIAL